MIRNLLILFSCLMSLLFVPMAEAHPDMMVRHAPPPRCASVPPPGYQSCFLVPPSYSCGVWAAQHHECYYPNTPDIWVSAHWECTRFYPVTGVCGAWRWVPSYWLRVPVVVMPRPVYVVPPPPPLPPPPPPVVMAPPPVIVGPPPVFINIGNGCRRHHHCW